MKDNERKKLPGDVILDHYMPNANAREREEARLTLYAFVQCLFEIAAQKDWQPSSHGDSPSAADGVTL